MKNSPDTLFGIDPWKLQRDVMLRSGQDVPAYFKFGASGLTYTALCLEEMGELAVAVCAFLDSMVVPIADPLDVLSIQYLRRVEHLRSLLRGVGQGLKIASQQVREFVAAPNNPPLDFSMGFKEDAVLEMLDGVTDLMVVAAGFSVACGLPGAAAFANVNESNISKANPRTGQIDIDPSGKWIKGKNYHAPELVSLIRWCEPNSIPVDLTGNSSARIFGTEDEDGI